MILLKLFDRRMFAPVETPAEDAFDDQVVGGSGSADTNAEVDLPFRRDVKIGDGEDLLLLVVEWIERPEASVVGIVFDAAADLSCEVVAHLCSRSEPEALVHVRAMPGSFQRWIYSEVPAAKGLVDDRANLPRPGIGRVDGALISDLGGDAEADRPVPGVWDPNAGADVVADPLDAVAILLAGEDVETDFGPVVDALCEFQRLVLLMVGWVDSADEVLLPQRSEVGVQLNHQTFRGDGFRAVNLDLVVPLRPCE